MRNAEQQKLDNEVTWKYLKKAYKACPHCGADPKVQEIRYFMNIWNDGLLFCNHCDIYLKIVDVL